ncbi:Zip-domain-containing protein [Periconia macrospinosa]|uniref:Zip-domain-containing protein n=1 Tax=Periconia macrospinosa TaxID=97972 RepID=A0A2V1DBK2_9PLEO|nr:Zip-domain-containing protein [Periconia macrospinosa]
MRPSASFAAVAAAALFSASAFAQTTSPPTTPPPTTITRAATATFTAVSDCHPHGTVQFCMAGTAEYEVVGATRTEQMEPQYTGCHPHGAEIFCLKANGDEVELVGDRPSEDEHDHEHGDEHDENHDHNAEATSGERNCHFHAGVEHCVGGAEEEATCARTDREYNKGLRVGLLFVILATSAFGVFCPILLSKFTRMSQKNILFVVLKQFGTGVILSTAFIHLFTHAALMFGNDCLGELDYEGTTAAVFLAGLFLSFLVDYVGARIVLRRKGALAPSDAESPAPTHTEAKAATPASAASSSDHGGEHLHPHSGGEDKLNALVLEAGIIFHSLLIGITLVVAGDSFFKILFVVILFHQMFEGLALGTCIAALPSSAASYLYKFGMAAAFALVTPVGMAIGIGVLDQFNGNDPSTLIAIGTLDALSAGILAWVGMVEMLARDWMQGSLLHAGPIRSAVGLGSLVLGMALMSLLGKWA